MARIKAMFCIIVASFLFAGYGCGKSGDEETSYGSLAKKISLPTAKAGGFIIPADGTPGERIKSLWEATSPIMRSDAQSNLGDHEYQEKRTSIFSAWVMLQGNLSLAGEKDEAARRVIPEILKFVDNLYGFPGYKPERRAKDRETAKKYFNDRFEQLNHEIKALK